MNFDFDSHPPSVSSSPLTPPRYPYGDASFAYGDSYAPATQFDHGKREVSWTAQGQNYHQHQLQFQQQQMHLQQNQRQQRHQVGLFREGSGDHQGDPLGRSADDTNGYAPLDLEV